MIRADFRHGEASQIHNVHCGPRERPELQTPEINGSGKAAPFEYSDCVVHPFGGQFHAFSRWEVVIPGSDSTNFVFEYFFLPPLVKPRRRWEAPTVGNQPWAWWRSGMAGRRLVGQGATRAKKKGSRQCKHMQAQIWFTLYCWYIIYRIWRGDLPLFLNANSCTPRNQLVAVVLIWFVLCRRIYFGEYSRSINYSYLCFPYDWETTNGGCFLLMVWILDGTY